MTANKQFGLIGYPLGHSWSQDYFSAKFKNENIEGCSYRLFPIQDVKALSNLLKENPNLSGLNVTIPHKEAIIALADDLSDTARAVGAVNTIVIKRTGSKIHITGYNTDVYGFEKSLEIHRVIKHASPEIKKTHTDKHYGSALILGTGGASKAVRYVLQKLGWEIGLVSRKPEQSHHGNYKVMRYGNISREDMRRYKLIVNTTPLGMYPEVSGYPDIPYKWLTKDNILYDLVYNPISTRFLEFGKNAGCQIIGGLDMLKLQADKSFEIWMK
jgi:shikimate dehydrogenase